MIPAVPDLLPPDQALGIRSRSPERTHSTGPWPAGPRSQQRKSRAARAYAGLSLSYEPCPDRVCDSCAAEVTAPAFLHCPPSAGPATAKSSARERPRRGSLRCSHSRDAKRKAAQCFHRELRPPQNEHCVHQVHSSVCTADGIPIDPLGSALVSLWVFQKNQHDARIVHEGKREAMRPSFWERASMTRRGGSVIVAGCALI
jgi:hypothetical protein